MASSPTENGKVLFVLFTPFTSCFSFSFLYVTATMFNIIFLGQVTDSDICALNERFVGNLPQSELDVFGEDAVMILPDHDSCRGYNAY
jgi:hypothetical protein